MSIILIISICLLVIVTAILIWGGVTNWKFIPKKKENYSTEAAHINTKWKKIKTPSEKCISKKQSQSQLNQDLWVLDRTNCKKNGYYIDMGSHDGQWISNTAVLDNKFNWDGLCIDINPKNMGERSCKIVKEVLYDKSGKTIKFKEANDLGGISDHIKGDYHKKRTSNAKEVTYTTTSAKKVFNQYNIPKIVDFLDMDIEGAELKILEGMEKDKVFKNYCFRNIGIEHNFIEPERSEIRKLLERNDYIYEGSEKFDDYYTNNCKGY